MYNIVTIERRYASGGNEIGKKLAEALGYTLYDRNILIKAAKNLEIPYFQIESLEESTSGGILMNLSKTALGGLSGNRELPLADKLFLRRSVLLKKPQRQETASSSAELPDTFSERRKMPCEYSSTRTRRSGSEEPSSVRALNRPKPKML